MGGLSSESAAPFGCAPDRPGVRAAYASDPANGAVSGFLALSDALREESAAMIASLEALKVQPVLLTGDHAGSVFVIIHSALLLSWKSRGN